ncbi:unnamed protein product, partial [Ectocarpus sp. 12 AP-2014]
VDRLLYRFYVVRHTAITMFRPPVCRATLTISRFGTPAPSILNTRYPFASSPPLSVSGALSFKFQYCSWRHHDSRHSPSNLSPNPSSVCIPRMPPHPTTPLLSATHSSCQLPSDDTNTHRRL